MLTRLGVYGLLALLITACGPVYKTETRYLPPVDQRGKDCALQCESQRAQCDNSCRQTYQACSQQARMEGRMRYLSAKESYLNQKASCLERGGKDCHKASEPSESSYLSDSHCNEECGCEASFDRCFQICGGQVQRFTRCVSDCQ